MCTLQADTETSQSRGPTYLGVTGNQQGQARDYQTNYAKSNAPHKVSYALKRGSRGRPDYGTDATIHRDLLSPPPTDIRHGEHSRRAM
jgi:hypothetical protein